MNSPRQQNTSGCPEEYPRKHSRLFQVNLTVSKYQMYISITDPCISCVNNVNQKEQKKKYFFLGGGGASEIRQTWGAHVLKG